MVLLVELFCAVMASMLTLFSYHMCPPTKGVSTQWLDVPANPQPHACSWNEDLNFDGIRPLQRAAFLVNLLTLFFWLVSAVVFLYRDQWIANAFEEERGFAYGNLPLVLRGYPSLRDKLRRHNMAAVVASGALGGLSVCNFGVSMFALCFYEGTYGGYKTPLGVLINQLLVAPKLAFLVQVAQDSWSNGWAVSGTIVGRLNLNTVDDALLGAANYV